VKVSRNHAELRIGAQGPVLTDLGSSNGTFIGDQRLSANQPQVLTHGTTFRIGPYLLTYQAVKPVSLPQEGEEDTPPKLEAPSIPPAPAPIPSPAQPAVPLPKQQTIGSATVSVTSRARPGVPQRLEPVRRHPSSESLYLRSLPDIFQEDDFLRRFLLIFEEIWEPLEQRQDHIAMYFDPRTCPASFLPWLASWLGLSLNPHWPEERHRRLLRHAMELYRWRGTSYGLKRIIEECTGLTPMIMESPSQPFVFQIRVVLPPESSSETRDLIEELIQTNKPAHAGYILEVKT
jgi:phage tail-like protein